jgi:hypothetical protein
MVVDVTYTIFSEMTSFILAKFMEDYEKWIFVQDIITFTKQQGNAKQKTADPFFRATSLRTSSLTVTDFVSHFNLSASKSPG